MVPGQIGLVQATEVIKQILGIGRPMIGKFFVYDALEGYYKVLSVDKNPDCPLCGQKPSITGLDSAQESCLNHCGGNGIPQA